MTEPDAHHSAERRRPRRRPTGASRSPLRAVRSRGLPVVAVARTEDRGLDWQGLRSVHGPVFPGYGRDGHGAHVGRLGGPRQRPLRGAGIGHVGFASDLLNETLASPSVNRHQKGGKVIAEWTRALNACWFGARTLEVRRKYGPTIDRAEGRRPRSLSACEGAEMQTVECAMGSRRAEGAPIGHAQSAGDMDAWLCGTTTATDASPARRPGYKASSRSRAAMPHPATCATGTATGWSASNLRNAPRGHFATARSCPSIPR